MPAIRVFLAVQNRLLRDTLARVLSRRGEVELAGSGTPGPEVVDEIAKIGCDVLLLDSIDREWLSCFTAQGRSERKTVRIVAIGMPSEREPFLEAVRCGVLGYLLNDASVSDVVGAVRAVACGETSCPPQMYALLFQHVAQNQRDGSHPKLPGNAALTVRQQKLMRLVATGMSNKEIADQLCLSEFTVKNHMSRILKQLNVANRSEAAEVARAYGYAAG